MENKIVSNNTLNKTILLVEDEAVLSAVLSEAVKSFGYSVIIANSGEKAVKLTVENEEIDLILMDIGLGSGIDGADAARIILKERAIPIIFLTTHSERAMIEKVRGITRYGYVLKSAGDFVIQTTIELAFELFDANKKLKETEVKKRSDNALIESEIFFRLLLDTANEGIIIAQDGMMKFMNRKTLELFEGYSEEELYSRPFVNFIYTEDRELVLQNHLRRLNGETVETRYAFRVVSFGGVVKWMEINAVLIDWEGRPATLNFYTDITEQKHTEDELKKSEFFARATLDALTRSIAILNSDGVIIAVNRAWREFAENNSHDISGLCEGADYLAVCDKSAARNSDEARQVAEGIRSVMSGEREVFSLDYPCDSPDEKNWFNVRITRFEYEGTVRIVTSHENITQRKNQESALRSFSYVVEQSPVSIIITDTQGIIQYANAAAEQTTGYPGRELLGNNPRILKSDYIKAEQYKELWETITSGKNWKGEFHNIRKDGSAYWESAVISPILDENGIITRFAAVKEDISEKKKSDEKIQNLIREKELLLKEVHHRIKNNMNTIKGLLYLQASALKDPSAQEALHNAESRVHSMMLLYDKLYCSHDFREISVKSYLGPLVDEIMDNFPERGKVKVLKDIGDIVLDANIILPLGIIVNELLTNIMKYAFTGRDSGVVNISASKIGEHVGIIVGDDGKGIPESVTFEKSTGFGMQLVGMLTEQIEGHIRIDRGNGTRFILEFKAV